MLAKRLIDAGFRDVQVERVNAPVRLESALECLQVEQECFGALHQMPGGLSAQEQADAWPEIEAALGAFDSSGRFDGPCQVLVACGTK